MWNETEAWDLLEVMQPDSANELFSYPIDFRPDSSYRLEIFDDAFGTCCYAGHGWFTMIIAESVSEEHSNGTVIWNATGDVSDGRMEVRFFVDSIGNAAVIDVCGGLVPCIEKPWIDVNLLLGMAKS